MRIQRYWLRVRHLVIGGLLLLMGMLLLPDVPWYRELPAVLLIMAAGRQVNHGR